MSTQAFANTIIDKLKSAIGTEGQNYSDSTPSAAMQAIADGITEYLTENTQVIISYSGIIPGTPPVPDPVVTDTFQITGVCAPTGVCNSFDEWLQQIEANIIAGFMLTPTGQVGLAFPTLPWNIKGITTQRDTLKDLHTSNADDPQTVVWTQICQDIMLWAMGTGINYTPGAATNTKSGSAGQAMITQIIVT